MTFWTCPTSPRGFLAQRLPPCNAAVKPKRRKTRHSSSGFCGNHRLTYSHCNAGPVGLQLVRPSNSAPRSERCRHPPRLAASGSALCRPCLHGLLSLFLSNPGQRREQSARTSTSMTLLPQFMRSGFSVFDFFYLLAHRLKGYPGASVQCVISGLL